MLFIGDKEADEAENFAYTYEKLRELDPVASNRIHPNDQRKVSILPTHMSLFSSLILKYKQGTQCFKCLFHFVKERMEKERKL